MTGKNELIDELLKECNSPEDIMGEGGLLNAAKKLTMPIQNWVDTMNQISIMFEQRMAYLD